MLGVEVSEEGRKHTVSRKGSQLSRPSITPFWRLKPKLRLNVGHVAWTRRLAVGPGHDLPINHRRLLPPCPFSFLWFHCQEDPLRKNELTRIGFIWAELSFLFGREQKSKLVICPTIIYSFKKQLQSKSNGKKTKRNPRSPRSCTKSSSFPFQNTKLICLQFSWRFQNPTLTWCWRYIL